MQVFNTHFYSQNIQDDNLGLGRAYKARVYGNLPYYHYFHASIETQVA